MTRRQTLFAWLDLVRAPNLITAAADILAGFLYVGGGVDDAKTLALLAVASVFLYAGGVVLNDVADAGRDAIERPERPIPSGRVRRSNAALAAVGLLIAGACLPWLASAKAGAIALALTLAILLYVLPLKQTKFAPVLMGTCRGLNLLMGMSLAPDLALPHILVPCGSMWLYVSSVTVLARREAAAPPIRHGLFDYVGVFLGPLSLGLLVVLTPNVQVGFLPGVAILLFAVALATSFTSSGADSKTQQRAIKWLVLCIIGFDACIASSTRGLMGAILVGVLFIPAIGLSKRLRVT
jgi:4-hydroxybenzoate polyprenyltransferase